MKIQESNSYGNMADNLDNRKNRKRLESTCIMLVMTTRTKN